VVSKGCPRWPMAADKGAHNDGLTGGQEAGWRGQYARRGQGAFYMRARGEKVTRWLEHGV
jgi:hypothetical protein